MPRWNALLGTACAFAARIVPRKLLACNRLRVCSNIGGEAQHCACQKLKTKMTLDRQIEAAQRELELRESCYPRWVRDGKMSESKAAYQISAMKAILQTLRWVRTYQHADYTTAHRPEAA